MEMIEKISKYLLISSAALLVPACGINAQSSEAKPQSAQQLTLKKGQYLSVVMPDAKEGGDKIRGDYYQRAFPLGSQFGLEREIGLNVDDIIFSDFKPASLIFFSYPDPASERKLSNHADWPEIKAMRPKAWNELKVYSASLDNDLDLKFDPEKSYTLVVAWVNSDNPGDYARYLDGITPAVEAAGGRFIYKMHNPQYEAHGSSLLAPQQLTFVEWDTLDGFAKVRASPEYKEYSRYFASGITKVEFYRMSLPKK